MRSGFFATQRLFIALTPPAPVRSAVAELRSPSQNVRWTPTDQLHVTLRFLGEVTRDLSEILIDRLATIRVEPFVLPIEGVGAFPQKSLPRVLWVGVGSGHPRLHQLRKQVDDTLLAVGADADLRTFHPHITVGRCNEKAAPAVKAWVRTYRDFAGPVFMVETFDLYASELHPTGAVHRLLVSFPLAV